METVAGAIAIEKAPVPVTGVLSESLALTETLKLPLEVGVPEMTPVLAARDKPAGRLPETTLHA
jgi:hypothetical protein